MAHRWFAYRYAAYPRDYGFSRLVPEGMARTSGLVLLFAICMLAVASKAVTQGGAPPSRAQVERYNAARNQATAGNLQAAQAAFAALCREGVAVACTSEATVRAALSKGDRYNAARDLISAGRYREAMSAFGALCREGMPEGCTMERRIQAELPNIDRMGLEKGASASPGYAARPSQPATGAVPVPRTPVTNNREPRTEPTSDVSDCLSVSKKPGFGAFENRCTYRVAYVFCVLEPPKEAWSSAHPCIAGESPKTLGFIGPGSVDGAHNRGGKYTYWLACRHTLGTKDIVSYDIDIRSVKFNAGVGITGRCLKTVRPAG